MIGRGRGGFPALLLFREVLQVESEEVGGSVSLSERSLLVGLKPMNLDLFWMELSDLIFWMELSPLLLPALADVVEAISVKCTYLHYSDCHLVLFLLSTFNAKTRFLRLDRLVSRI
jgi:hypothetical protein